MQVHLGPTYVGANSIRPQPRDVPVGKS